MPRLPLLLPRELDDEDSSDCDDEPLMPSLERPEEPLMPELWFAPRDEPEPDDELRLELEPDEALMPESPLPERLLDPELLEDERSLLEPEDELDEPDDPFAEAFRPP